MRHKYEQVVMYTDILEDIIRQAYDSGASSASSQHPLDKNSHEYAARKIQWIRDAIATSFVFPRHVLKEFIIDEKTPPESTVDSLIDMGFGTTENK